MKLMTGLLLVVILLCSSCGERKSGQVKSPIRVKTEVLTSGGQAGSSSYVGIVEEREATAVSFINMGVIRRMLVSEGQAVSAGQLLAEMDDTQARNLLSGSEAAMKQANDALERYSQLHESGSLTEAQWVEIESKVAQARSQLAVAQKNLDDCRLKAPVSGIIGRKAMGVGETARPTQAVVTILDISSVTQPTLTFKRRQPQGASDVDELSVWYRSSSNDNWQLLEYFPLPTEGWETEIVNLPNPSQNYQIAFVGMGYNAEGIYVDDVEVGKRSVGIAENQIATAVVSPNPTTGKAMLETGILEGEASVYDMFGKFVTSARISEGRAEIDLTQCTRGVYAVRLNGANASTIIKLVKE